MKQRLALVLVAAACVTAAAVSCARPAAPAKPAVAVFDLEEATVADLQKRMETGQDTSRSIVDKYLARIAEIDAAGPALHSVIEINPDARAIADAPTR